MEQAKHTPGPWRTRLATGTCDTLISGADAGVAVIPFRYGTPESRAANARLIAAAPDLYAACILAREWLANSVPTCEIGGPKPLPVIEAAIAKAEGRK